jgi:hypothetical protein
MREPLDTKAKRYVLEGRLTVHRVDADGPVVEASVRGSGAVYAVGHDESGWYCGCPARTTCSHLLALQLVVVRPGQVTA